MGADFIVTWTDAPRPPMGVEEAEGFLGHAKAVGHARIDAFDFLHPVDNEYELNIILDELHLYDFDDGMELPEDHEETAEERVARARKVLHKALDELIPDPIGKGPGEKWTGPVN